MLRTTSKRRRTDRNLKPRAIDLFSGCGGLTLGLKQVGFEVVGAVESDHLSADSYEMNHATTRLWRQDICSITTLKIKRALNIKKGELDLLVGCPPCQGFSTLVTNNGCYNINDPRNSLIYQFLRFIEDFMPRAILMENVPDLARTTRFHRFRSRLKKLGYQSDFRILDAVFYGVPQRRKRLVLLAGLGELPPFARPARVRKTVRSALSNFKSMSNKADSLHDTSSKRSERIQQLIERVPKNGGSRTEIKYFRQLKCHQTFDGFYDIYGRMRWDDPAPTITSGCINPSKGRFLHPTKNRPITLREAALLQTFPLKYRISLKEGKYKAAAQIGNAFPPEFARRQGLMIIRYLNNMRCSE